MEEEKKKRKTVVLYPGAGVGHLAPMLELAKTFLRHDPHHHQLSVAVVVVEPPVFTNGFAATLADAKSSNSSISFHVLPKPPPPPPPPPPPSSSSAAADDSEPLPQLLRFLRASNPALRALLLTLSSSSSSQIIQALILDMFCADALDVAADLAIPAYFFFPSGGAGLACFLALPATLATLCAGGGSFAALGPTAVLTFPGAPPLAVADMPQGLERDGGARDGILAAAARMAAEARGVLVNSFDALEPCATRALRDGLCVGGDSPGRPIPTPPVYFVGPLVVSPGSGGEKVVAGGEHECLRWMDEQPDRSVVFLCFGSMGVLPKTQLAEIAVGLERSGQRFLWVVRRPSPVPGGDGADDGGGDGELLLPAGFEERTEGRGLVVRDWAPQVDVLAHRAAGAFVTHCGWNSALEAVVAGMPMLCWPLYAEQKMNRARIVEEMKLGVAMAMAMATEDGDDGEVEVGVTVTAEEVEAKVRWVMGESDGARELRERAAAARERAEQAMAEGGPSRVAFVEFLEDMLAGVGGRQG